MSPGRQHRRASSAGSSPPGIRYVPAKVIRPAVPHALPRERLFRRIERAPGALWISGRAGSGKTTLVASYVAARSGRCLWYRLDGGDVELSTFFHFLGHATKKAAPRSRKPLPALTPEYRLGTAQFGRRFFGSVFARLGSPSILVFDDAHAVADDAALWSAFLEGMGLLPERCRILFLSRTGPPPAFARLCANGELATLEDDALRLTLAEFEGIVRRHAKQGASRGTLRRLHRELDGWAAGLQLLLNVSGDRGLANLEITGDAQQEVFDYFSSEVFEQLSSASRDFLLTTSLLPSMTARMAEALTGRSRAGRLLDALHRRNLFTEVRGGSPRVYSYHPLFRAFLIARAQRQRTPEEIASHQRAAARLLMAAGEPEPAADLLERARDWDGLVALALGQAPVLLMQGRSETLRTCIERLPPETIERSPWLLFWLGASHMPAGASRARIHFERAFSLFREGGDATGVLLAWSGVVDAIIWGFGSLHELEPWLEKLPELARPETLSEGPVASRLAASAYAALVTHRPEHPDRPAWESAALAHTDVASDVGARMQVLLSALGLACWRADHPQVERLALRLEEESHGPSVPVFGKLIASLGAIYERMSIGDYEPCDALMARGLALARESGVHVLDLLLLGNGAHAALQRGDTERARTCVEQMVPRAERGTVSERSFLHHLRARLALADGMGDEAAALADRALEEAAFLGFSFTELLGRVLRADVAGAQGDVATARRELRTALRRCRETGFTSLALSAHLVEAGLRFDGGDSAAGLRSLKRALTLGAKGVFPFLFRRDALAEACGRALEAGVEPATARAWIRAQALVPADPLVAPEGWPWLVEIRTLGRFELRLRGVPAPTPRKAQRRPLAMLQLLIAFGPEGASEDRVSDTLWPDATGDAAHQAFATTLHRLRRLLGSHDAVSLHGRHVGLDPRHCRVDAWTMEALLDATERTRRAPRDAREQRAPLEAAIALYEGPFLPDVSREGWPVPTRERLRSRFVRAVEHRGDDLERAGHLRDAVEAYRRALEVEPLCEGFYRRLMRCHQRLGERAEALMVYRRCRQVLGEVLGLEPSAETEHARRALGD